MPKSQSPPKDVSNAAKPVRRVAQSVPATQLKSPPAAAAAVAKILGIVNSDKVEVINKGGAHHVEIKDGNIYLMGMPEALYRGMIEI